MAGKATRKGKKRKKNSYPPEVTRYMQSQEYKWLQALIHLPGGAPLVHQLQTIDDPEQSVASFLSVIGRIAASTNVGLPKDFRFLFHHRLQYPAPQYTPSGYPPAVVQHARNLLTSAGPTITVSNAPVELSEDRSVLQAKANQFLMEIDFHVHALLEWIHEGVGSSFAKTGLVSFQATLRDRLRQFDAAWVTFEKLLCEHLGNAVTQVYKPVDDIVEVEGKLTAAEDAGVSKLARWFTLGRETLKGAQQLALFSSPRGALLPQLLSYKEYYTIPPNAIEEAEACVFYQCKLPGYIVEAAKTFIKQYFRVRGGVHSVRTLFRDLPLKRLLLDLPANEELVRVTHHFYLSGKACDSGFECARRLPVIPFDKPIWLKEPSDLLSNFQQCCRPQQVQIA